MALNVLRWLNEIRSTIGRRKALLREARKPGSGAPTSSPDPLGTGTEQPLIPVDPTDQNAPEHPLAIFVSYGHDEHVEEAIKIVEGLTGR
jgi:hypothetical protein